MVWSLCRAGGEAGGCEVDGSIEQLFLYMSYRRSSRPLLCTSPIGPSEPLRVVYTRTPSMLSARVHVVRQARDELSRACALRGSAARAVDGSFKRGLRPPLEAQERVWRWKRTADETERIPRRAIGTTASEVAVSKIQTPVEHHTTLITHPPPPPPPPRDKGLEPVIKCGAGAGDQRER